MAALSPHTKDRLSLLLTAVALFVGVALVAVVLAGPFGVTNPDRATWRIVMVGIIAVAILAPVAPRVRHRVQDWHHRRADEPTTIPEPAPAVSGRGIRRLDLYLAAGLIVGAIVWYAAANRYTVTMHRSTGEIVFLRTDRWTGSTELYLLGSKSQPRPEWVRFAGEPGR